MNTNHPAVDVQGPDPKYQIDYWTISGDLPDTDSNYAVEDWVKENLPDNLKGAIEFDSESGCFFAYAKNEIHARAFAKYMNARPWKGKVAADD